MAINRKKLYETAKKNYDLCKIIQQREDVKSKQGSTLAKHRVTELNQCLTVFQFNCDCLNKMGSDTIDQEELEEINDGIEEMRNRFIDLVKNPQSAGKTGEIAAEEAEKEKVKYTQSEE